MKSGDKTGGVIGALTVRDTDEIMLITVGGQMVRTFVRDIRQAGRNTMGVNLVDLDPATNFKPSGGFAVKSALSPAVFFGS